MAQTRRTVTSRTNRIANGSNRGNGNARGGEQAAYIYDNTARQLDVRRQLEEEPRKRLSHVTRKNRDKARHMSLGYVAFLVAALCTCGMILINYIQLQSELTTKRQEVARLESVVNSMRLSNDEEYSRIISNIDLEEIKRIAIGELGMTYAREGQIIPYSNTGTDYMRRVTDN